MAIDNRRWSARRGRTLRETRDRHERKHQHSHQPQQQRAVNNHHGAASRNNHGILGAPQGNHAQMNDHQSIMHRSPAPSHPPLIPNPPVHEAGDGTGMPSNAPSHAPYSGTGPTSGAGARYSGRSASLDLAIDELVRWGLEQGQRMRMGMGYAAASPGHGAKLLQYGEVQEQEHRHEQQLGLRSGAGGRSGTYGRGSFWRPRYGAYGRDDGGDGGERSLGSAPYKDHWKGFLRKRD